MSVKIEDANELFAILRRQQSPREAAALLAFVRAKLHIAAGAATETKVRGMMKDDDNGLLRAWSDLTETALSS